MAHFPTQQPRQGFHPFGGVDAQNALLFNASAIEFRGYNARFAPVAPVNDLDPGPRGRQRQGKGILEGATGRVVTLPRIPHQGIGRREEDQKIQGLLASQFHQQPTARHLGSQGRLQGRRGHGAQAGILQHQGGMNHSSQGPPGLLNLLDQTGHGDGIRHIDRSVLGDRPQSREFPQLGGSPFGEGAATRQNQLDPGDCRQTFGRFVANASHATHD